MLSVGGELDNQLYPSGSGGTKGGAKDGIFGATQAEKEAAGAAKGRVEAAELQAKEIAVIEGAGFSKTAATALWQRGKVAEEEAKVLKAKADSFNYNKKDYAASSKFVSHETGVQAYSIFSEAVKSGGTTEDVNNAIAKMEALRLQAEGVLTQGMRNKAGEVVGDGADFETANGSITKAVNHFSKLLKEDFAKAKVLAKQLEEKVNGTSIQTHDTLQALYGGNKVFAALMNSGNQELSKLGIEIVSEIDGTKNRLKGVSNKLFGRVIEGLSSEELGANVAEAVKDVSLGGDEGKTDEEKEESLNYFSVVAVTKSGPALAASSYGQGRDEEVDDKFFNSPIAIDQVGNSRWWNSYARTDPNALRALDKMIEGAAARSQTVQFATHKKKQVTKRGRKGGLSSRSTETVSTGGIPQTIVVTPIAKGKRGRGGVSYSINSGGVTLTDEYKKNITSAYKLGAAHEGLWKSDFDNVDQWINSMFAEGELPEVEEGEAGAAVKKEPFSLISNAGASELDPSEVDAGFPAEPIIDTMLDKFAISEGTKTIKSLEGGPDTLPYGIKNTQGLKKEEGEDDRGFAGRVAEKHLESLKTLSGENWDRFPPEVQEAFFDYHWNAGATPGFKKALAEANVPEAMKQTMDNFGSEMTASKDKIAVPGLAKRRAESWNEVFPENPIEKVTFKKEGDKTLVTYEGPSGTVLEFKTDKPISDNFKTTKDSASIKVANSSDTNSNPESPKSLLGDLDKIDKQRNMLKLFSANKNLTFQEMVDEGIIDTTLEQELF